MVLLGLFVHTGTGRLEENKVSKSLQETPSTGSEQYYCSTVKYRHNSYTYIFIFEIFLYNTLQALFVEWLMSPVSKRPSAVEVCRSERLGELKEMVHYSDFTYIPKL